MNVEALDAHRLCCPGRESCCPRSLEKDQVGSLGHSFGLFLEKIYVFIYLAMPGLRCGLGGGLQSSLWHVGSILVVAC